MALLSAAAISAKMKSEFNMVARYSFVLPPRFDEWAPEMRMVVWQLVSNVNQVYSEERRRESSRLLKIHVPYGCSGADLAEAHLNLYKAEAESEKNSKQIYVKTYEAVQELMDVLGRYHDIECSTRHKDS